MNKLVKSLKVITLATSFALAANASAADVLKVGTEGTYAPFEFVDIQNKGKLIGFDIDIMQAIADDLGLELEVVNMGFDGLIPALMTKQIDVVAAAMTVTPERAKKIDFSNKYYKSGLSVIVDKSNKDKYKTVDDVKGQRLCAQIGTTGAMTAEKFSPGNVAAFNTQAEVFLELKNGGCVAIVNDRPVNLYYITQTKNSDAYEIPERITAEDYALGVARGNTELLEKINASLVKLQESGKLAEIHKKWFSVSE